MALLGGCPNCKNTIILPDIGDAHCDKCGWPTTESEPDDLKQQQVAALERIADVLERLFEMKYGTDLMRYGSARGQTETPQSWPHDWDDSFGRTPEKKMSREELYGQDES